MSIPPMFSGNLSFWPHFGHVFTVLSVMTWLDLSEYLIRKCARATRVAESQKQT